MADDAPDEIPNTERYQLPPRPLANEEIEQTQVIAPPRGSRTSGGRGRVDRPPTSPRQPPPAPPVRQPAPAPTPGGEPRTHLQLRPPGGAPTSHEFQQRLIALGRGPGCDLVLGDDPHISRIHILIHATGDHYFVQDNGTVNGTLLNSQPLTAYRLYPLAADDQITIEEHTVTILEG